MTLVTHPAAYHAILRRVKARRILGMTALAALVPSECDIGVTVRVIENRVQSLCLAQQGVRTVDLRSFVTLAIDLQSSLHRQSVSLTRW
jgi:hypothetical protein